MPLYLKACDVIFTKPGGLTSTEAAVSGIPIVHIRPIPGCETEKQEIFPDAWNERFRKDCDWSGGKRCASDPR